MAKMRMGINDFFATMLECALRGTILWGRVSSPKQARESINSKQMQMDAAWGTVDQLGIPRSVTTPLWAFGESGRKDSDGSMFATLLDLIAQDKVGLIVVYQYHRMARKLLRAAELFERCAAKGVMFYVNGELRDPSDPNDLFFMQTIANTSEWQVSAMLEHNSAAKFVAASEYRLRKPLPSGLCWASDQDPDYRKRMDDEGLLAYLDPERLRLTIAKSNWQGRAYYPLPVPDRHVVDSMRLRFEWLFESRALVEVRRRITDGTRWGWPAGRAGLVPQRISHLWSAQQSIVWSPISQDQLYKWFKNPALFGIYSYYGTTVESRQLTTRRIGRRKGVHYGRARQLLESPLPTVAQLLVD